MNGQLTNGLLFNGPKTFMTVEWICTASWKSLPKRHQTGRVTKRKMTSWMSSGEPFDFVYANNDEMAIGAIQAMKAAGMDMADVQVGVDASQDALLVMAAGDYV